jgi:hypothetical protein
VTPARLAEAECQYELHVAPWPNVAPRVVTLEHRPEALSEELARIRRPRDVLVPVLLNFAPAVVPAVGMRSPRLRPRNPRHRITASSEASDYCCARRFRRLKQADGPSSQQALALTQPDPGTSGSGGFRGSR